MKTESAINELKPLPELYHSQPSQVDINRGEIQHLSVGQVKLHDILKLCEVGWFIELYLSPDSCKYYAIEQNGDETIIDKWEKRGINLNHTVFYDGYDPEDKIIFAYLWKFDGVHPDKN